MLNDETKRKLRELNIGEIIDAIEFQNQDPVTAELIYRENARVSFFSTPCPRR